MDHVSEDGVRPTSHAKACCIELGPCGTLMLASRRITITARKATCNRYQIRDLYMLVEHDAWPEAACSIAWSDTAH